MKLTISAAARMYGKHRATLHRHIQQGRLSCVFQPDGSRALDVSELIRCYGEAPNPPDDMRQVATGSATPHATPHATPNQTPDNAALLARFDALLEVVKEQRDELKGLRKEVHELRTLPAPGQLAAHPDDATPPTPAPPESVPVGSPPRDFGDLLARFEARKKPH